MADPEPLTTSKTDVPAFVIVDTPDSNAVIQPGHPSAVASAYTITITIAGTTPTDDELDAAVQAFIHASTFPNNSHVYAVTVDNTVDYTLAQTITRNP